MTTRSHCALGDHTGSFCVYRPRASDKWACGPCIIAERKEAGLPVPGFLKGGR